MTVERNESVRFVRLSFKLNAIALAESDAADQLAEALCLALSSGYALRGGNDGLASA